MSVPVCCKIETWFEFVKEVKHELIQEWWLHPTKGWRRGKKTRKQTYIRNPYNRWPKTGYSVRIVK